jgi:hypothetical protein
VNGASLGLCPLMDFGSSGGEPSGSVIIHSVCSLCKVVVKLSDMMKFMFFYQ